MLETHNPIDVLARHLHWMLNHVHLRRVMVMLKLARHLLWMLNHVHLVVAAPKCPQEEAL